MSSDLRVRLCGEVRSVTISAWVPFANAACSGRMLTPHVLVCLLLPRCFLQLTFLRRDEFTTSNWTIDTPNNVQQSAEHYAEIPYMNDLPSLTRQAILPSDEQCAGHRSRYLLREFNTNFYAWGRDIYDWSVRTFDIMNDCTLIVRRQVFADAKNLHGSLEPVRIHRRGRQSLIAPLQIHWALCEWREWVSVEGRSVHKENLRMYVLAVDWCADALGSRASADWVMLRGDVHPQTLMPHLSLQCHL